MKIFAIKEENKKNIGFLFYYEKTKEFNIELIDNFTEWDIPMLLSTLYKKGQRSINNYWSKLWVEQRIIPFDRQNLGQILRDNKLKQYDEFKLLCLASGRCEQDNFYLSKIKEVDLPIEIKDRLSKRIKTFYRLENNKLLVCFKNNKLKVCNPIIDNFKTAYISNNGYEINYGKNIIQSYLDLYNNGIELGLTEVDLKTIIKEETINTSDAMKILNCTRQYINELVKKEILHPVKNTEKSTIFLKSEVQNLNWN